jgi:imidazolonepropionase-like amidohydrolase
LLLAVLLVATCGGGREVGTTVFTHVNVVPMTSETVVGDQTVLIRDGRIEAIGTAEAVPIPAGARVIRGEGAYLMPGLADMHVHTRQDWDDATVWPVHPLRLYLAYGVTAIRDMAPEGSPLTYALAWRDEIEAGTRDGPAIYASGELLYASPLADPAEIVRRNHDLGFDFLKLYSYLSPEDFRASMVAAKELGMYTTGHIPYAAGLEGALAEGMDEIAHVEELLPEFVEFDRSRSLAPAEWLGYVVDSARAQWDLSAGSLPAGFDVENRPALARIAGQLRSAGVPVCTTMVIDDVIQHKLFRPDAFVAQPELRYLPAAYRSRFQIGEEKHQVLFRGIEELAATKWAVDQWILAGLHEGGVMLLLGTDSGTGGMGIVPGISLHEELQILVESGLSPYEAISTGTVHAARVVERMVGDGGWGTVQEGQRADLILVGGNPLEDVGVIREPLGVMAAGRWYDRAVLLEMIELAAPAAVEGE